jgi:dTDP-4-amino-4,6-dideoxygalactose transaminase
MTMAYLDPFLADAREAIDWWRETDGAPTSANAGTGAVRALEDEVAEQVGVRFVLALSSCTAALRAAMAGLGVGAGCRVAVPAGEWPAAAAAGHSLGAKVLHTTGGGTDVQVVVLRNGDPSVPVEGPYEQIEDQTLLTTWRSPFGSAACVSLGEGKSVDAGGGGLLFTDDEDLFRRAVAATQHPTRQVLAGSAPSAAHSTADRIHPVAAIVALWQLRTRDIEDDRQSQFRTGSAVA